MVIEIRAEKLVMSVALAAAILSTNAPAGATQPGSEVREDRFDRSTPAQAPTRAPINGHVSSVRINPPPVRNIPHPEVTPDSTPQEWFTALDVYVGFFRPTDKDKYVINTPFNDEVEKVTAFCKTVTGVARNYRALAKSLKSMPISNNLPDPQKVREYRDLLANWYNDSAIVYEDMVRPRPPAKTKEELQGMIQSIKDRSESLKSNLELLQKMDSDIRLTCHVDPPRYDDVLRKYTGEAGYAGHR